MPRLIRTLRRFLTQTCGAVTIDYVILTAAATGVGLASKDVVIDGLRGLADTVNDEVSEDATVDPAAGLTYADGFDNGATGWAGATATSIFGVGHVLGPIGGSGGAASVTRDFVMLPGLSHATMTFDVLALDSLDGESGIIYLYGQEVGRVTSMSGYSTFAPAPGMPPGIKISAQVVDQQTQLGGYSNNDDWGRDSRTTVSITVANPGERLNFGFGSTADQSHLDESFALDNFRITGLDNKTR